MNRAALTYALPFALLAGLQVSPEASAAVPAGTAGSPRSLPATAARPVVVIQPLGVVKPRLIRAVTERIEGTFAVRVRVLPAKPLPEAAFYRPRRRYRGERIVEWLAGSKPRDVAASLALMSRDLSVTKGSVYDWGVMGVASPSRAAGVVSTHRLGRRASASLETRRTCQVAVHELGHSLGVDHCRSARCIMNDAHGGIAAVDRSSGRFCSSCRSRLAGWLRNEPRRSAS